MNIVYFMGAGFSRAFGLPMMREFFQTASDSDRLSPDDKAYLTEIRRAILQSAARLAGDVDNLEHVLSLVNMSRRLCVSMADDRGMPDRLVRILARVYSTVRPDFLGTLQAVPAFLDLPRDGDGDHRVAFVTTNYDVALEHSCSRSRHRVVSITPAMPDEAIASHISLGRAPTTVPLCKLHGSVSWWIDSTSELPRADDALVEIMDPSSDEFRRQHLPRVCLPNHTFSGVPVIVPPSFAKPEPVKGLDKVWRAAAKLIGDARRLVFVGYSFPESDIEMRYFFAAALRDSVNLNEILIIDPRAAEIRDRLSTLGFGPDFLQRVIPVVQRWEFGISVEQMLGQARNGTLPAPR